MRVDLCGPHVLVPEQFLNRPDVRSIGQQVSGKGMTKRVTTGMLLDTQFTDYSANRFLQIRRIKVVSAAGATTRIY